MAQVARCHLVICIYLSVHLSTCLLVFLSTCLPVYVSTYLSNQVARPTTHAALFRYLQSSMTEWPWLAAAHAPPRRPRSPRVLRATLWAQE